MTADQYREALNALGLTQRGAAKWMGTSLKTQTNYASKGPSGPAAKALEIVLAIKALDKLETDADGYLAVRWAYVSSLLPGMGANG